MDGNKQNSAASNLQWCTPSENSAHAQKTGLVKNFSIPVLKLDKETKAVVKRYSSLKEAWKELNVKHCTLNRAIKRQTELQGFVWALEQKEEKVLASFSELLPHIKETDWASERWKKVTDVKFCSKYQVSNLGRVRNGKHFVKPRTHLNGYEIVILYSGRHKKNCFVHRLVAEAFHSNTKQNGPMVNHLDENKRNNCARNLKWVSPRENSEHSVAHAVIGRNAKTGEETIWRSKRLAAKAIGYNASTIERSIRNGRELNGYFFRRSDKRPSDTEGEAQALDEEGGEEEDEMDEDGEEEEEDEMDEDREEEEEDEMDEDDGEEEDEIDEDDEEEDDEIDQDDEEDDEIDEDDEEAEDDMHEEQNDGNEQYVDEEEEGEEEGEEDVDDADNERLSEKYEHEWKTLVAKLRNS